VAEGVLRLIEARQPEVVVLSGDLTQRAKPEQFRQARAFVDRMPVPVVVVPGNHDVPLYRVWERVFSPYGAYRRHFADELEPVYQGESLAIVGLNTAHGWTLKDGRLSLHRLRQLEHQLSRLPEDSFKVVVAHHHLIPPPTFGTQKVLTNAYEAIEILSAAGVDLVLSGHLHQAYVGSSEEFYPRGRHPVVILHSGTTTSSRGRGVEKERNTCNWVEVGPRCLQVSHLRWHGETAAFAEHSRHLYPRQGRDLSGSEGLAL
jgi:3',5'-cyclic AMP phosphodiesterase CpdA